MLSIHEITLSGVPEGDISLRETFKEGFDRVLNTKNRCLSRGAEFLSLFENLLVWKAL